MEKNYLKFDSVDAYKTAFDLSNYIWKIVIKWDSFTKSTVGRQLVTSADSISANVAEGFGRYHKKDKVKFYRYSNGSLLESMDWINKSKYWGLITPEEFDFIRSVQDKLPYELNRLIQYTNQKLKY
ncbi:MAG: four helix bundle protein [Bacteroidales bacterium]|nr:four helix bundle protein [Bacteroidales bacterium]